MVSLPESCSGFECVLTKGKEDSSVLGEDWGEEDYMERKKPSSLVGLGNALSSQIFVETQVCPSRASLKYLYKAKFCGGST